MPRQRQRTALTSPRAFQLLPLELNEHIATFLTTDRDIVTYDSICWETRSAVHSHRCGVWRAQFAREYDLPPSKTGRDLKNTYMIRSMQLRQKTFFGYGHNYQEVRCIAILRDLIVESYADVTVGYTATRPSKNILRLRRFVEESRILRNVMSRPERHPFFNPLLKTLQLVLTHWQLDLSLPYNVHGFDYSQQVVYSHPDKHPIFTNKRCFQVNIEFLLHTANFFKAHMTVPGEQLYDLFKDLQDNEKPQAWDGPLLQGPGVQKLGRHWKGTYAYLPDLDDMTEIRSVNVEARGHGQGPVDAIDYEDGFQSLDLDFSPLANKLDWPAAFEDALHALPPLSLCKQLQTFYTDDTDDDTDDGIDLETPGRDRAQGRHHHRRTLTPIENCNNQLASPPSTPQNTASTLRIATSRTAATSAEIRATSPLSPPLTQPRKGIDFLPFSGSGTDAEPFSCTGILHNLPEQHEIPGWQRISMMKYFLPSAATATAAPAPAPVPAPMTTSELFAISPTTTSARSSQKKSTTPSTATGGAAPSFPAKNGNGYDDDDDDRVLDEHCWAYEGVVLPGGGIILGRWWAPMEEGGEARSTGPFIFWNVKDDEAVAGGN